MCVICLKYPILLSEEEEQLNKCRRTVTSIRGDGSSIFLSKIWFDLIEPNNWYWGNNSAFEVMSVCLIRPIFDGKIVWNSHDEEKLINCAAYLLNKFNTLKVFI
jgi:hypothetical protein